MHYYSLNIGDWNLATSHLTPEEEAIYFRLVNFYYDTEAPIPTETQSVFRRLRLGSYAETARFILEEFFVLEEDGWHHLRCDEELQMYAGKCETNRENGKKGGRPPKAKRRKSTGGAASRANNPVGFSGKPNDNPDITLTNNQEPLTNNQEPNNKNPPTPLAGSGKKFDPLTITLPDCVPADLWRKWAEYRKRKQKPISLDAAKEQIAKFESWHAEGLDLSAIVSNSIANDWTGLFPKQEKSSGGPRQHAEPVRRQARQVYQ
jgi:uncharacterized protein YdaU (DUF1376 family)